MYQDKVIIKQIPDEYAVGTGLAKYNRSRMPRCVDRLSPAQNIDGRFITGLDENALNINTIQNQEERDEKIKEIKSLRESLESQIGFDLSGTSDFWKTFSVDIDSDRDTILNRSNPMDVIRYHVLVSNGYAAPSKDEAGNPKYFNAKYFVFTAAVEDKEKVSVRKLKDKARSELLKLENKPETMLLIGQFLEGPRYNKAHEADTLYTMLSDYIEDTRSDAKDNVNNFLKVVGKDVAELQFKITIDKAIRAKVIKFKDKYYQRGQVTLGRTVNEVYSNLQSPEFAGEFASIQNEIESK